MRLFIVAAVVALLSGVVAGAAVTSVFVWVLRDQIRRKRDG